MTKPTLTLFEGSPDEATSWTRTPLRMELLGPLARPQAMAFWRDVEERLSNQRLMCSSVWTETWLKHYGTLVPHRFVLAWRGETCCGAALLTNGVGQFDGPMPLKTWHVGTAGEPDADSVCIEYNSLLIGNDDREDFARQLIAWTSSQSDCDETRFDGFSANDIAPLLAAQPQALATGKPSHYFDLNAAREANVAPIKLLGRRTRARLRRSLRQLDQPIGEWADTPERAEASTSSPVSPATSAGSRHTRPEMVWAVARRPRLKFAVLDNLRWIKRTLTGLDESPPSEIPHTNQHGTRCRRVRLKSADQVPFTYQPAQNNGSCQTCLPPNSNHCCSSRTPPLTRRRDRCAFAMSA